MKKTISFRDILAAIYATIILITYSFVIFLLYCILGTLFSILLLFNCLVIFAVQLVVSGFKKNVLTEFVYFMREIFMNYFRFYKNFRKVFNSYNRSTKSISVDIEHDMEAEAKFLNGYIIQNIILCIAIVVSLFFRG